MKFTLHLALICGATILLSVACSPRSYVNAPLSVAEQQGGAARSYARSPEAIRANNLAPKKVPSPEDKLIKNAQDKNKEQSIDFATATEQSEAKPTENEIPQNEIWQEEQDKPKVVEDALSAPLPNAFIGNETEHIKFSRYNPFGSQNSFSITLDNLDYCYPIAGKLSSGYGPRGRSFHSGVDLIAPANTPIYAIFDGIVRLSKPYSGYGNVIVIRHANGLETVYSHNAKNLVRVGQQVSRGEQIARCGRTGRATTNHLHFEVRVQGSTINPTLLIDPTARTLQGGTLTLTRSSSGSIAARKAGTESNDKLVAHATAKETEKEKPQEVEKQINDTPPPTSHTVSANASRGIRVGETVYQAPKSQATKATLHTIVRGDTMSGIARRYGTSVAKICALNDMSSSQADKIRAGQKLRVK
ncbi:MAG: peptidoglycan DD-metalloendopeptidase family protein [Mucinivorans sp.]